MLSGRTKGFEFLNLTKTKIDLLNKFKFVKELQFTNLQEMERALKNTQYPNTIAITQYDIKNAYLYDFLWIENIAPGGRAYFLSKRLKQAITEQGCTGIEFEKVEQWH